MGNRGPVSLAELVDRSVGIASGIIDLLENDPALSSRPSIKAAAARAKGVAGHAGKPPGRTALSARLHRDHRFMWSSSPA